MKSCLNNKIQKIEPPRLSADHPHHQSDQHGDNERDCGRSHHNRLGPYRRYGNADKAAKEKVNQYLLHWTQASVFFIPLTIFIAEEIMDDMSPMFAGTISVLPVFAS